MLIWLSMISSRRQKLAVDVAEAVELLGELLREALPKLGVASVGPAEAVSQGDVEPSGVQLVEPSGVQPVELSEVQPVEFSEVHLVEQPVEHSVLEVLSVEPPPEVHSEGQPQEELSEEQLLKLHLDHSRDLLS